METFRTKEQSRGGEPVARGDGQRWSVWWLFSPSRVLQQVVQPPGTLRFVPEFKNDLVAFANGRPWLLWWWSN